MTITLNLDHPQDENYFRQDLIIVVIKKIISDIVNVIANDDDDDNDGAILNPTPI